MALGLGMKYYGRVGVRGVGGGVGGVGGVRGGVGVGVRGVGGVGGVGGVRGVGGGVRGVGVGVACDSELNNLSSLSIACPRPHFNNSTILTSKSTPPPPLIRAHSTPLLDNVGDCKFYKVEAILRPWRIEKVSLALVKMGIRGVTVSDVRGFGAQGGAAERHAGSEFSEDKFVAKVKMEIVVTKDQVESVIHLITHEARTGEIGDGKIFVIPVTDVIRVRTGERGEQAERMSGGRHDSTKANSSP